MPFKSKAQHRLFRYLESKGKLPKGTSSEWAEHTPSMAKLPERLHEQEEKPKEETKEAATGEFETQAPPNYRYALGMVNQCGNCMHFSGQGNICLRFDYPAESDYVCDAWEGNKKQLNAISLDTSTIPNQSSPSLGLGPIGGALKFAGVGNMQQGSVAGSPVKPLSPVTSGAVPATQTNQGAQPGVTPVDMVNQQQSQGQQPGAAIPAQNINQLLAQLNDQDSQMYRQTIQGLIQNGQQQQQPQQEMPVKQAYRLCDIASLDHLRAIERLAKIARCWKGYEPVPGKPAYSEDSCRPIGSAKKKKNKKKPK